MQHAHEPAVFLLVYHLSDWTLLVSPGAQQTSDFCFPSSDVARVRRLSESPITKQRRNG